MHKNETSHPIGFSSEKITLFAPLPSLFAPFFPPFSRQNPIIAHRNAKTPLLFRESPRLLLKTPKLFPIPRRFLPLTYARAFIYIWNHLPSRKFSRQTLCNLHIICTFAQRHEPSSHHERAKVVLPHRQSAESEALSPLPIRAKDETKALIALRHTLLLKFNPYAKTLFVHSHYGNAWCMFRCGIQRRRHSRHTTERNCFLSTSPFRSPRHCRKQSPWFSTCRTR